MATKNGWWRRCAWMALVMSIGVIPLSGSSSAFADAWTYVPVEDTTWTSPVVTFDPGGNVHVVLVDSGGTTLRYYTYAGQALSSPVDCAPAEISGHSAVYCPDGKVRVAYVESSGFGDWGPLMLATFSSSGCESVQQLVAGSFGYITSIAVDSDGYLHVAYREEQDIGLRYWSDRPDMAGGLGLIDTNCNPGRYLSLRVDSQNRPHIAYSHWGTCGFSYMWWDGSSWQRDAAPCGVTDTFRSLGMDLDAMDQPHISFHDETSNETKYAFKSAGGWCCGTLTTPESRYSNLELDSSGVPWAVADGRLHRRTGASCPYAWESEEFLPGDATTGYSRRYFDIGPDDTFCVAFQDDDGIKLAIKSAAENCFVSGYYCTGGYGNVVHEWSPEGTQTRVSDPLPGVSSGSNVTTWGWTPEGYLIVGTDMPGANEKVFELDCNLQPVRTYDVITGGPSNTNLQQAVVGPDDQMYVVGFQSFTPPGPNTVYVFDRTTMSQIGSFTTPNQEAIGICFHSDGYLYVSGWGSRDFARYEATPPYGQLGRWDIPGTGGVGAKVVEGPNGHLFISHGDGPNSGVVEIDVTSSPGTPSLVRPSYPASSLNTFDFNANGDLVAYSFVDPDHVFRVYSTSDGTLLDTDVLSPQVQPLGLVIAPSAACQPEVTEYVISEENTWTYAAADQLNLVQNGTTLDADLQYQIYNVVNPGGEIDQLFLAADWTLLSLIYNGNPGACPGVIDNWSANGIDLCGLSPGSHTLYAVRTAAVTPGDGEYHYEDEHGGWRVAIGTIELPDEDCNSNGISDVCEVDTDEDGVIDDCDNCPNEYNPGQEDCDGDGIGDVCDDDRDGDGVPNDVDACPDTPFCDVMPDGRPRLDLNEDCNVDGGDMQAIVEQLLSGCSACG